MSIRILPSDCIQLIFDRIPTHHLLLHTRRVCHAWQHNQQLNCRRRQSLIIHVLEEKESLSSRVYNKPFVEHRIDRNGNSVNHQFYIDHNRVKISVPHCLKVQFLVETFPRVHTLIVLNDDFFPSYIEQFCSLIECYSASLVTLQLSFHQILNMHNNITMLYTSNMIAKLFSKLNSMASLRCLVFDAISLPVRPRIEAPEFLTRIRELYFECGNLVDLMFYWLRKYDQAGQLAQLERIFLKPSYRGVWVNDRLIDTNVIEHIPLANLYAVVPYDRQVNNYNAEQLQRFVARFGSLTTISYTLGEFVKSITQLTTILSPLTKLVHIQLIIECALSTEPFSTTTDQLKSIKALDLVVNHAKLNPELKRQKYHDIFANIFQDQMDKIVHCFPCLQSIRIVHINYFYYRPVVEEVKVDKFCAQFFDNLRAAYGRPSLRTLSEYKHNEGIMYP